MITIPVFCSQNTSKLNNSYFFCDRPNRWIDNNPSDIKVKSSCNARDNLVWTTGKGYLMYEMTCVKLPEQIRRYSKTPNFERLIEPPNLA